ncbi:putative reverse transcriptase domain-containing protein [Tanacetum coccineum]
MEAYSYRATRVNDSLPRKEKDPGSFTLPCYINNVCFENALADLGAIVSVMPLSTYLNLGLGELAHIKLTVELADRTVKHPKGIAENVLVGIGKFIFPVDFIILDMPEDVKVPLILRRPILSTTHAKIDVFKRKITLRVGEEKIIFKSVKPASSLIKRVYMLSLKEHMELDLEARLMGETLVLNRSLDPLYGDYIELNDLNVPLELRRDQVDDLMPTIEEGEVIDKPMIDKIKTRNNESFGEYPSFCDFDWKIYIDCAYNLRFSCMIGFEHVNANFFPILSINVMSKKFYNSIIKDKVEYKGKNVVGAFMNVPIFVGIFFVVTHFAVVENMAGYRDQDIGDVIFGEPFCKASCVKAIRFDGLITIHNGNDNVTYQMARSHPRLKHLCNAQCNKIMPLLKDLAGKEIDLVKYRSSGILLIMEYLVKISKKARILGLKRRHLKITVLTSYTPTLRDILDTPNKLFSGKTIMLGGDFRQTLPVKKSASRTEIISLSIAESYLWRSFKLFVLTKNMRLTQGNLSETEKEEVSTFSNWLLNVGDETVGVPDESDSESTSRIEILAASNLFYQRMLLSHQKGCRSFQDIRIVNHVMYPTCRATCEAMGLLADDREWETTLKEASSTATPAEL